MWYEWVGHMQAYKLNIIIQEVTWRCHIQVLKIFFSVFLLLFTVTSNSIHDYIFYKMLLAFTWCYWINSCQVGMVKKKACYKHIAVCQTYTINLYSIITSLWCYKLVWTCLYYVCSFSTMKFAALIYYNWLERLEDDSLLRSLSSPCCWGFSCMQSGW